MPATLQPLPLIALLLSLVALLVAIRSYRRKSGLLLRGYFTVRGGINGLGGGIGTVFIENMKDRAIAVFGIYIRVGYNCMVDVESFDDQPLIIKPYEHYRTKIHPFHFYGTSDGKRVSEIEKLLLDKAIPKRIVLSTSDGMYVVPKRTNVWRPWDRKNPLSVRMHPATHWHNDEVPINWADLYAVDVEYKNGSQATHLLRFNDMSVDGIRIPGDVRGSGAVQEFLQDVIDRGDWAVKKFILTDYKNIENEWPLGLYRETLSIRPLGWSEYYIKGGWLQVLGALRNLRRKSSHTVGVSVTEPEDHECTRGDA